MSEIKIDLKEVKRANYTMAARKSQIGSVRRGMSLIRWKIPEQIQKEKDIKNRIADLIKELEKTEQEMDAIYNATNNAVSRYSETERVLNSRASRFE